MMDSFFVWVSIGVLLTIVVVYFLTKRKRMEAHEKMKAEKKPWTQVPQTNLSIGAALVLLGIVFTTESLVINYLLIGAGVAIPLYELYKTKLK